MDWKQIWETVQNWLTNTGIKVLVSIVLLIVSFALINWLSKKIEKRGKKLEETKKVDKTLYRTLSYVVKIGLKVLILVALIAYLGINTSGITALIASLGVGIGLAVNGTLSNLAGGVLILITRPFRVDDFICACGYEGTVQDILICHTKLRTSDNKVVYLPNGKLSTSEIVNYTEKGTRRVDITFSVSYENDFEKAKTIIIETAQADPLIFTDPAPFVRMSAQTSSSVELGAKVWCKASDYWTVKANLLENVKKAFDANNIKIPFQQLDVHVKTDNALGSGDTASKI